MEFLAFPHLKTYQVAKYFLKEHSKELYSDYQWSDMPQGGEPLLTPLFNCYIYEQIYTTHA